MDQLSREIKELNEEENALADEEGVLQRQRQEADHHKAAIKAEINGQKDPFNVFKVRRNVYISIAAGGQLDSDASSFLPVHPYTAAPGAGSRSVWST